MSQTRFHVAARRHLADELVLAARRRRPCSCCARRTRSRRPRAGLQSSRCDELAHLAHVRDEQLLLEDARLTSSFTSLRPVGVARLEPRVQEDVREHALAEAVAERHAGRASAVGVMPSIDPRSQGWKGTPFSRLEQQRIEVEHAELAVADPRLALAQPLERADVDEHRPRALELHVVGRGVLEDQVVLERRQQQVELQQRGVPQHRERPLVRVRDERDALVAQDRRPARGRAGRRRRRCPSARSVRTTRSSSSRPVASSASKSLRPSGESAR